MKTAIHNFNSISQFYNYINQTPHHEFTEMQSSQKSGGYRREFTGTSTYREAADMFEHGWTEEAEKLTTILKSKMKFNNKTMNEIFKDVTGYQVIVPDYLMGVPNCMYNSRRVVQKQKVISLVKSISYNCNITKEQIEEESIKAFQIVNALESKGMRVNLYIAFMSEAGGKVVGAKVKIKSSNERLNVSKMAFPLVHPSMLRRLMFKFMEVNPEVTKSFVWGYGKALRSSEIARLKEFKNDYVLPDFFKGNPEDISSLDELDRYTA